MRQDNPKGLLIAAPQSGSGKTVLTLSLLRAFKLAGLNICSAKGGPDYIDPAFHAISTGVQSVNLDPWAMDRNRCRDLAARQMGSNTHMLVESMMGLYDGAADGSGSGANLASMLDIPVVLVVDAAKQSHSIGALVRGFRDHDQNVKLCGVILNRVGSARHETMLRQALDEIDMPVFGAVKRDQRLQLPERHLGLIQAGEISEIENFIDQAATIIAVQCDLERLAECFAPMNCAPLTTQNMIPAPGKNIAIARDRAFSFIYPHMLDDWRAQGAKISFFSPLGDEGPNEDAHAVYLPGGYPELHGKKIATAENFSALMNKAKKRNAFIYGECGGYMVLGKALLDSNGISYPMLGFLQLETSFARRKLHLGYRVIEVRNEVHGEFFAGKSFNGHEFHYSSVISQQGDPLFGVRDALGDNLGDHGLREGNVMGSYMHLIDTRIGGEFGSYPDGNSADVKLEISKERKGISDG